MERRDAFKAMFGLPVAATFTRIPADQLKATDVIVLECPEPLSADTIERLKTYLVPVFPGHKIVVLTQGMTLRVMAGEAPGAAAGWSQGHDEAQ